jgi:hypothetical protein
MGNTKIAKLRFEGGQWVAFWNEDVHSQYVDSSVDTSSIKENDVVQIELRLATVASNDENRYRAFIV